MEPMRVGVSECLMDSYSMHITRDESWEGCSGKRLLMPHLLVHITHQRERGKQERGTAAAL